MKRPVKLFWNPLTLASLSISLTAFSPASEPVPQFHSVENSHSRNVSSLASQTTENQTTAPPRTSQSSANLAGEMQSEQETDSKRDFGPQTSADVHFQAIPTSREIQGVWLSLRSRIAPMLTRLETTGGDETVDGVASIRESTGVLLNSEGFIFASATAFAHKPNAIIAITNDGKRFPAKLVSTDYVRKIALLKIDLPTDVSNDASPFRFPSAASIRDLRVGQKVVAFGRVVNPDVPDISLGVVGGKNRQRGTAVQINARVSPNNYGGPVVDLNGDVVGILTPFGMGENRLMTGAELYDSGVGFAIPLEDLFALLPRMKNEPELRPAPKIGIVFTNPSAFLAEPVILHVAENSPAAKAGLLVGDRIIRVNENPISTGAEFRKETARCFEGDAIRLAILRNNETLQREILLEDLEKKTEK